MGLSGLSQRRQAGSAKDGGGCSLRLLIALIILVAAGVGLRAMALVAWWPVVPRLGDPGFYSAFAAADPLGSPMHPDGYPLFLVAFTSVTRSIGAIVVVQHVVGVVAALVLFLAIRRLCGSPWPALVGAATVLLGADQVLLEHAIMSETLFVFLLSLTLYAVARMLSAPERWWPWAVLAGMLVAAAGVTRVVGLFLIPVVVLALLLTGPRPWVQRWRPAAAFLGVAGAVLLANGMANVVSDGHFEVAPTPGYHLYGRVAPFADCKDVDPPSGAETLCASTLPKGRSHHPDIYLFSWDSPAYHLMGRDSLAAIFDPARRDVTRAAVAEWGRLVRDHDGLLGAFARRAIIHQPGDYAAAVWTDVRSYFLPGTAASHTADPSAYGLSPLNWDRPADPPVFEQAMEMLFEPFTAEFNTQVLAQLRSYQHVFRFGATLLTVSTLLILLGLVIGPRRNRIAVLVLGGGGLAMFVLPTLSIAYVARYTVPVAGLMTAGAAVAVMSIACSVRAVWRRRGAAGRLQMETV
jgi:hypothetical protein